VRIRQIMNRRTVAWIAICLFALFVWPTRYRYEHQADGKLVRINGITGDTWALYQVGPWRHVDVAPSK
jgi:hypothetical protein